MGEKGTFLTLLGIFGKMNYPGLDVPGIIGREKMKESLFYQEILLEGELTATRASLLARLRARFGADAATEFTAALAELQELPRLNSLFDLAVTGTLAEFRAALRTQGATP